MLVAGYIRPKHISLTLFINLFQECRLHPSHSMGGPLDIGSDETYCINYKSSYQMFNNHLYLKGYLQMFDRSRESRESK